MDAIYGFSTASRYMIDAHEIADYFARRSDTVFTGREVADLLMQTPATGHYVISDLERILALPSAEDPDVR